VAPLGWLMLAPLGWLMLAPLRRGALVAAHIWVWWSQRKDRTVPRSRAG